MVKLGHFLEGSSKVGDHSIGDKPHVWLVFGEERSTRVTRITLENLRNNGRFLGNLRAFFRWHQALIPSSLDFFDSHEPNPSFVDPVWQHYTMGKWSSVSAILRPKLAVSATSTSATTITKSPSTCVAKPNWVSRHWKSDEGESVFEGFGCPDYSLPISSISWWN